MKTYILLTLLLISANLSAQKSEIEKVRSTIEKFFEGFHNQDSSLITQTTSKNIIMQTIAKDSLGNDFVLNEDFSKFLKSIVGIPESTKFKEVIMDYSIQIDGPMANAWTSYEFWLNDTFHHCGVNSFQLFKEDSQWKIIYLIDTRRKDNCE